MRMLHQVHVFFAVVGAGGFVQSKLSPQLCFVFIHSALVCGVTTASTARLPGLVGDGDGNGNGETERQMAALTHQVESVEIIRRGYRHNHRKSQQQQSGNNSSSSGAKSAILAAEHDHNDSSHFQQHQHQDARQQQLLSRSISPLARPRS